VTNGENRASSGELSRSRSFFSTGSIVCCLTFPVSSVSFSFSRDGNVVDLPLSFSVSFGI